MTWVTEEGRHTPGDSAGRSTGRGAGAPTPRGAGRRAGPLSARQKERMSVEIPTDLVTVFFRGFKKCSKGFRAGQSYKVANDNHQEKNRLSRLCVSVAGMPRGGRRGLPGQAWRAGASQPRAQPGHLPNLTAQQSLGCVTTREVSEAALLKKIPQGQS